MMMNHINQLNRHQSRLLVTAQSDKYKNRIHEKSSAIIENSFCCTRCAESTTLRHEFLNQQNKQPYNGGVNTTTTLALPLPVNIILSSVYNAKLCLKMAPTSPLSSAFGKSFAKQNMFYRWILQKSLSKARNCRNYPVGPRLYIPKSDSNFLKKVCSVYSRYVPVLAWCPWHILAVNSSYRSYYFLAY